MRYFLLLCLSLCSLAASGLAAAQTVGGIGGKIIKVTTLAPNGPGSLMEAINTEGPCVVVFEVGGVIDLAKEEIKITKPFLTIAGQTAPSPGITLIRTGIDVSTHDVVLQHIRVRVGGAVDENLSASGPRFTGTTPEEWREGTSHDITFSNNILAEGLADSTHAKGEHSKGSLIHDNVSDILIVGNLYAHNYERSPLFKGGVHGMIINNLIYDPGARAIHYNLIPEEWSGNAYQTGQMTVIGNVMRAGPSTIDDIAFFMLGGSGDVALYEEDNIAVDRIGNDLPKFGRYTTSSAQILPMEKPTLPAGLVPLPAVQVEESVILNAGARPWDRDAIDARIVANTIEGRGAIIDDEAEVAGYPTYAETRQAFVESDWDLATMNSKVAPTGRNVPR